MTFISW